MGDDPRSFAAPDEDRRPATASDAPDSQEARLVLGPRRNLEQRLIPPKRLRLDKVYAVLNLVAGALLWIEFEVHFGRFSMEIIPFQPRIAVTRAKSPFLRKLSGFAFGLGPRLPGARGRPRRASALWMKASDPSGRPIDSKRRSR